jgi:hypothetical protein
LPVHIRHNPLPSLKAHDATEDATKTRKQESVWTKQAETHFGRNCGGVTKFRREIETPVTRTYVFSTAPTIHSMTTSYGYP